MNYTQAIEYLYARGHEMETMNLGLSRILALTAACGQPQLQYPSVLIAGTNGKGSTAAMTFAIARAAGLRVGLYTSPHLVEITERMRIADGAEVRDISQDEFAHYATEVRRLGERLLAAGELSTVPSLFEQLTLLAFLYFAAQKVDLAVLEVGLGGRLDATNVSAPLVTAITPIDYDHQRHLGYTLPEIAGEKAGIIKPGTPVIVAPQSSAVMQVIAARANELRAPLLSLEEELSAALFLETVVEHEDAVSPLLGLCRLRYTHRQGEYDVRLGLRGRYQVTNALLAIHIGEALRRAGLPITSASINTGLQQAEWPGRLELATLPGAKVPLLLDGAHNPAGAQVLRDFLQEFCAHVPVTMVFGVMTDKPFGEMEEILFPAATTIIAAKVDNPRAADPTELAQRAEALGYHVLQAESVRAALQLAQETTPANGVICACGSLYLVGEIKGLLGSSSLEQYHLLPQAVPHS
ncbi:MAG: bifunctional folylpolyglutamate synthase/dihydrofolate synthase [Acidobacteria bacterium]|nr:bifunctional folylpolyglutamate synthase/dihydrofolate synthase [Acidobacteriota bacterium]MBI3424470.1 bifunctional folylpolyglutamate synthase/dihydrofolate synthase [Acidobacteriota bacterium]